MRIIDIIVRGKMAELLFESGETLQVPYLAVFDNRIEKGQDLDEATYVKLITDAELDRCFAYALGYLSKYSSTEKNLMRKLREHEYSKLASNMTIDRLKDLGYIDDRRYAERFVESRISRMGKYKLKAELYQKGVPNDIIDEVLGEVDSDDIYASAWNTARKWLNSHSIEDNKDRDKYYRYMQYRGYDFGTIKAVLQDLEVNDDD